MKQLYSNVAVFGTTVLSYHSLVSMADNPKMKNNDLSQRRCRYRIVLEGQTEEQTDNALIQESSVGVQTQLTEKALTT